MHIGFDNTRRLARSVYYFEYNGIRYKLIQNRRPSADVLLVICNDNEFKITEERAFTTAGEFLSALSWQNNSRVKLTPIGGPGIPEGYTLRQATCNTFTFQKVPFAGHVVGCSIHTIPKVENQNQRMALILNREALSSNNDYLSFLFYWQILSITGNNPIGWVNKVFRKHRSKLYINEDELKYIDFKGKTIGDYFNDDRRHAIAHIKRIGNKTTLDFDTLEENREAAVSTRVVAEFAKYYINYELKLDKKLYLVKRCNGDQFPFYADESCLAKYRCKIAYPNVNPLKFMKKHKISQKDLN